MRTLFLAPGVLAGIIAHAQADYPEEACGLIAGAAPGAPAGSHAIQREFPVEEWGFLSIRQGPATVGENQVMGCGLELFRGRNVASDPQHHFVLDVDTLARQIEFAERGLCVSAIYHSHPYGPETPSSEDIALALYPDAIHIICSLARPALPVVRGFLIADQKVSEVCLRQSLDKGDTI